jgi:uncharacterized protein YjgD (DUF1641 family)
MAYPIPLHVPPRDPREELRARLDRAPDEHAEAMLALFDILQELHDREVLDIVRSALAASDTILAAIVGAANTPQGIRVLRHMLMFGRLLGTIDPDRLERLLQAIPAAIEQEEALPDEKLATWNLLRRARSSDSRRGLAAALAALETGGRSHSPNGRPSRGAAATAPTAIEQTPS